MDSEDTRDQKRICIGAKSDGDNWLYFFVARFSKSNCPLKNCGCVPTTPDKDFPGVGQIDLPLTSLEYLEA